MNNKNFLVYPLFSSPVSVVKVEEDFFNLKKYFSECSFRETNAIGSENVFMSENLNILDEFCDEKQILFEYFTDYKNEVLKFESTNFRITTSWITKTESNGFSQFHNHSNSVYSGVYYFDEVGGGNLEFQSYNILPEQIKINDPSELGILNSKTWEITPEKNMLVFFPSYLYHRITQNKSLKTRYSLAFNLFPCGIIENSDSTIYFA